MSTKPTFDLSDQQSLLDKNVINALATYMHLTPDDFKGTTFENGTKMRLMHVMLKPIHRSISHKVPSVFYGCLTDITFTPPELKPVKSDKVAPSNAPQDGAKTANATKGDTL